MTRNLFIPFVAAAVLAGTAHAALIDVTNTFDAGQAPPAGGPGPSGPVIPTDTNGVHALGITFGFSSLSGASTYGITIDTVANALAPLSDPVLDGPADGVLTLDFDYPSTFLEFDLMLFVPDGGDSGGIVSIGGDDEIFTATGGFGAGGFFGFAHFSWTPDSPFSQATITFDSDTASNFALDNLAYNALIDTPEPGTSTMLGLGAILLGFLRNRRAASRSLD